MNTVLSQPNRGGRPAGAVNHATRSMKAVVQRFFESEEYRQSITRRILDGSAPTIELYFWQMLCGKPRETIDLNVGTQEDDDLSTLSTAELVEKAAELTLKLKQAHELEQAIEAIPITDVAGEP